MINLLIQFPTMTSTLSRMIHLMSLAPGPIRALADIETLGPICFITFHKKVNFINELYAGKEAVHKTGRRSAIETNKS